MLDRAEIKKTIQSRKLLLPGDKLLLGFSGGSDSAVLAHVLAKLREELGFSLELIYIQHNLREQESHREEAFVKRWANRFDCPFRVVPVDVRQTAAEQKLSLETAARQLRHQVFRQIAAAEGFTKIALAHHSNDQAETVLMHFLRGSGVHGLAGMKVADGIYFRPLLPYSKSEIMEYIRKERIPWVEDSSNQTLDYRRNRIRLELIPYLEENFNPNIVGGLSEFAEQMQDLENYLDLQIETAFTKALAEQPKAGESRQKTEVTLEIPVLQELPAYLRQMVIRRAFQESKGNTVNLEKTHIHRALSLMGKEHGKWEDLVDGWRVRKSYNNLIFEHKEKKEPDCLQAEPKKGDGFFMLGLDRITRNRYIKVIKDYIFIGAITRKKEHVTKQSAWTEVFDFERLPANLVFRFPREGDYFIMNRNGNRKKLKDYFAENKIAREKRGQIPVLASENEIIWVVGHRIGYPYRATDQTNQYLKLMILGRTGKCRKLRKESQRQK